MFNGKNIFSWNIPSVAKGEPVAFAQTIVDGDFEGLFLKGADGNQIHTVTGWGENIKPDLVAALRDAGLKVYIWQFLYGVNLSGELKVAQLQCDKFKPDGWIWNAETTFDNQLRSDEKARYLSAGLKKSHPNIPQALCWWALPLDPKNYAKEWHPIKVAKAFMEIVDCVMPMMYWGGSSSSDALTYINRSYPIWKYLTTLPILPIGRAYNGDAGTKDAAAIAAFAQKFMEISKTQNAPGISWWVLDQVVKDLSCWNALRNTPKYGVMSKLSVEEMVLRLARAHPALFPELL